MTKRRRPTSKASAVPRGAAFDRYEYYENAVQDAPLTVRNLAQTYRRLRGRDARLFLEDFCGTAANSEAWVVRHRDNRAVGVDLDPEPLAWAKARRFAPESKAGERVRLIRASVMNRQVRGFDLIAALNFSWMIFETRKELLAYFKRVRASLAKEGVFCLDLYGGPDTEKPTLDHTRMDGFDYYWEQKSWEALTGHVRNAIHFKIDGKMRKNVFTYDWRLWTLDTTIELLRDSGLEILEVQDEIADNDSPESSIYKPIKRLVNSESFVVNVYAGRR